MKMSRLISVPAAAARILRAVKPLGTERVALASAAGRVLRETIRADRPQPPYDRVTMDGFALHAKHWKSGTRSFPIVGVQRAGEPPLRFPTTGGCIEIMTGAVLPDGCDTVVPVEMAKRNGDEVAFTAVAPGRFIHRRGSDLKRGASVLCRGTRMEGAAVGIAAAVGCKSPLVSRIPRIALITTGDEVVPVSARPLPHQIRASNAAALAASLRACGLDDIRVGHVPDQPTRLKSALASALMRSDVLILTGGVSKGRFDLIPEVLASLGVREILHGVAQQPGKPMWFGVARSGALVFGLPGNPVSALVCLHRYVLPALAKMTGVSGSQTMRVVVEKVPGGPRVVSWFRPAVLTQGSDARLAARLVPMKNSGDFFPLADSDGFVEIPPGCDRGPFVFRSWRSQ